MVRFLHTGDWQLGMTRHFLSDDAQARFSAARIDVISAIGALAVQEDCDFVVVAGDVFESNHVSRRILARSLAAMAATPATTFYLLPGNHDPLDASSVFRSPTFVEHCPANVVVLDHTEPLDVAPGTSLLAAPWRSKRPLTDLVGDAIARCEADGTTRIVVGHGGVDVLAANASDPSVILMDRVEQALARGAVHYVALGDRHSTTGIGPSGRVFYSGAPEPTDFDEVDPGNVVLVELSPEICNVSIHSVGTWRFVDRRFDVSGEIDLDLLEGWLCSLTDPTRTVVRLSLVGQISLAHKTRLDQMLDHQRDLLGALLTWERNSELIVLPDQADFEVLALSGFAEDALDELRELASSGADDGTTQAALGLLYRLVVSGP